MLKEELKNRDLEAGTTVVIVRWIGWDVDLNRKKKNEDEEL